MTAVPTKRPRRTMTTRVVLRRMFRAASRASNGRAAIRMLTRTIPTTTADAAISGRAMRLGAPRLFDDLSVPHPEDPMRSRAHNSVMRDEDERLPLLAVQPDQEIHDLSGRFRIEVAGRFVRPYYRRIVHESPRNRNALLLTRTELGGLVFRPSVELDLFDDCERLSAGLLGGDLRHKEGQLDVLYRGEDGQQVVRLKHEAHPAGAVSTLRVVIHSR